MFYELMKQYKQLSDEEKNALLVYKTGLGLLINDLDNDPDFEYFYDRYKRIASSPQNILLQSIVFDSIDFTTLDTFKESIYKINDIIRESTNKIITTEPIHVYRAISSNGEITGLSKGDYISTSLSFAETLKYAIAGNNIKIYDILLPAGSHVAVSPYAILDDKKNDRLIFSQSGEQEEVVLNTNNFEFTVEKETITDGVSYYVMSAKDLTQKQARN